MKNCPAGGRKGARLRGERSKATTYSGSCSSVFMVIMLNYQAFDEGSCLRKKKKERKEKKPNGFDGCEDGTYGRVSSLHQVCDTRVKNREAGVKKKQTLAFC